MQNEDAEQIRKKSLQLSKYSHNEPCNLLYFKAFLYFNNLPKIFQSYSSRAPAPAKRIQCLSKLTHRVDCGAKADFSLHSCMNINKHVSLVLSVYLILLRLFRFLLYRIFGRCHCAEARILPLSLDPAALPVITSRPEGASIQQQERQASRSQDKGDFPDDLQNNGRFISYIQSIFLVGLVSVLYGKPFLNIYCVSSGLTSLFVAIVYFTLSFIHHCSSDSCFVVLLFSQITI